MRELIYYVATSLDGFIAAKDGALDGFLWNDEFGAELLNSYPETFPAHLRGGNWTRADNRVFDAVLMGRKTYEVGLQSGVTSPYPTLDQYVFSHTFQASHDNDVELIQEDAIATVTALKQDSGRAIWLCGGAELATTLFSANLIDHLIVKLNPVLFGSGIPLFHGSISQKHLILNDSKVFNSGHMILRYKIEQ